MPLPPTPRAEPALSTALPGLTTLALALTVLGGCATHPTQTASLSTSATKPASIQDSVPHPDTDDDRRFAQWVARFQASARSAGIDDATLHAAFDTVRYRPRIIQSDRNQPEFTRAIWDYLDLIVSPQRIAAGQQKLAQYRDVANTAADHYGVPTSVLMGVWGMESNYGKNYGDIPVIDALATLGFEGRRENWAKGELLAALKILQRGDIDRDHMVGSWAGAMGQTQFMPTVFLHYAVDADGDGRCDIWGSMADVLASTANFLAQAGWQADEPWGVEVRLPADFNPVRADPGIRQDAERWTQEGLRAIDGSPLPRMADAAVLLPAGITGPAFLVGRNYRAILRYNNATSYALGVSLLAQAIAGGPPVQTPWPRELRPLNRDEVLSMQTALNQLGFDCGKPDGQFGPATRRALRDYQQRVQLPADGFPTADLLARLRSEAPASADPGASNSP